MSNSFLWRCASCDGQFPRLTTRAEHMIAEHGYHGCPDCGRAFSTLNNLGQHRRAAHGAAAKQREAIRSISPRPETAPAPEARTRHGRFVLPESIIAFARRHGLACTWCGEPVRLDVATTHPLSPTREHLVPRAAKGPSTQDNLVLAHAECNRRRGAIEATAYRRLLRGEALTAAELWPHLYGPSGDYSPFNSPRAIRGDSSAVSEPERA